MERPTPPPSPSVSQAAEQPTTKNFILLLPPDTAKEAADELALVLILLWHFLELSEENQVLRPAWDERLSL
jgi:hypothetical protein